MKYTTPSIVNNLEKPKGLARILIRRPLKDGFYRAKHNSGDISLLWAESKRLGEVVSYPSAIVADGALHVFRSGAEHRQANKEMIRLWKRLVSPKTFGQEYRLTELEEGEYDALFQHCRELSAAGGDAAAGNPLED